jgi:hypothetical protein
MPSAWTSLAKAWAVFLLLSATAMAENLDQTPLTVSVEKLSSTGDWRPVEQDEVLASQTWIRFRVKTAVSGRLYGLAEGTSGQSQVIFPLQSMDQRNVAAAGMEFVLPREGAFQVTGPAGEDVVYWVLTPGSPAGRIGSAPEHGSRLHTLVPRCDDAAFASGFQCSGARPGAAVVRSEAGIRENAGRSNQMRARDLRFGQPPSPSERVNRQSDGPVVVEVRIKHL